MNQSMLAVPQSMSPPLDLYGPVAADLEEVERILSQTLKSRYAQVKDVSLVIDEQDIKVHHAVIIVCLLWEINN